MIFRFKSICIQSDYSVAVYKHRFFTNYLNFDTTCSSNIVIQGLWFLFRRKKSRFTVPLITVSIKKLRTNEKGHDAWRCNFPAFFCLRQRVILGSVTKRVFIFFFFAKSYFRNSDDYRQKIACERRNTHYWCYGFFKTSRGFVWVLCCFE